VADPLVRHVGEQFGHRNVIAVVHDDQLEVAVTLS
jgi:hypothetical protein